MKLVGKLRWRHSFGYHYLEDEKYGYAHVHRISVDCPRTEDEVWHWSSPSEMGSTRLLKDAKKAAEKSTRRVVRT